MQQQKNNALERATKNNSFGDFSNQFDNKSRHNGIPGETLREAEKNSTGRKPQHVVHCRCCQTFQARRAAEKNTACARLESSLLRAVLERFQAILIPGIQQFEVHIGGMSASRFSRPYLMGGSRLFRCFSTSKGFVGAHR